MRSNAVAWNPQEPMNFVCANEDTNLYTFDLRNLNQVGFVMITLLALQYSVSVEGLTGPCRCTSYGLLYLARPTYGPGIYFC